MSWSQLSRSTINKLGETILGTVSYDLITVLELLGDTHPDIKKDMESLPIQLEEELIEDDLEEINIERCYLCGWWCESWELINSDGDVVGCHDCRNDYPQD